jgi:hypothetical protein
MTGIATIGGNLYVTGDIVYDEITGRNLNITGFSTFADDIIIGVGATVGFGTSAFFRDTAAICMGADSDLKIHHDSVNSWVQDTGTGALYLDSNGSVVKITKSDADETMANFYIDGPVELYWDDTKRLATTAIGATVFGDFKTSGVGTFGSFYSVGVSTIATNTTFDSYGLSVSTGATITTLGNAAFAGIVTANGGLRVGNVGTIDSNTGNVNVTGITTIGTALSMADNVKAQFGTGGDLIIYHSGSRWY